MAGSNSMYTLISFLCFSFVHSLALVRRLAALWAISKTLDL
jgi:hypothetical protein